MKHAPLSNYLRTARRRLSLSQEEVAFLLNMTSRTVVSYHERGTHLPKLQHVLGYTAIFGFSADALFAGLYQEIEQQIAKRAEGLVADLREKNDKGLKQRKLETLLSLSEREPLIISV